MVAVSADAFEQALASGRHRLPIVRRAEGQEPTAAQPQQVEDGIDRLVRRGHTQPAANQYRTSEPTARSAPRGGQIEVVAAMRATRLRIGAGPRHGSDALANQPQDVQVPSRTCSRRLPL